MGILLMALIGAGLTSGTFALVMRQRLDQLRGQPYLDRLEIASTTASLYRWVGVFSIAIGGILSLYSESPLSPSLGGGVVLIGVGVVAWLRPAVARI